MIATQKKSRKEKHVGQCWIVKTEIFGYAMYASEVGAGWSDNRDEASIFDARDNRQLKLSFFNAIIGMLGDKSATCEIEEV